MGSSPSTQKRSRALKRALALFLKKYGATLSILLFCILLFFYPKPTIDQKQPLQLLFNQCDDELRSLFCREIKRANKSIFLSIYSLNDAKILEALEMALQKGVRLKIFTDPKNRCPSEALKESLEYAQKTSKLMHQKILVIDEERVWIGSANFTSSSLRTHDNGIVGILDEKVARALLEKRGGEFEVGGQKLSLYLLPQEQKGALAHLINLLNGAKSSIKVAMYTWTHPELTELLLRKNRDIEVKIAIDSASYTGTSKKSMQQLREGKVDLLLPNFSPMFHHKMAYIDGTTLILGSTNWTKAAFTKNDEILLIIHQLSEKQRKKMDSLWHILHSTGSPP